MHFHGVARDCVLRLGVVALVVCNGLPQMKHPQRDPERLHQRSSISFPEIGPTSNGPMLVAPWAPPRRSETPGGVAEQHKYRQNDDTLGNRAGMAMLMTPRVGTKPPVTDRRPFVTSQHDVHGVDFRGEGFGLRGRNYSVLIATGLASSLGARVATRMVEPTTTSVWKALVACSLSALIGAIATVVVCGQRQKFGAGSPQVDRSKRDPVSRFRHFLGDHYLETLCVLAFLGILVMMWYSGCLTDAFQTVMVDVVLFLLILTIASCCLRASLMGIRRQLNDLDAKLGGMQHAAAQDFSVQGLADGSFGAGAGPGGTASWSGGTGASASGGQTVATTRPAGSNWPFG